MDHKCPFRVNLSHAYKRARVIGQKAVYLISKDERVIFSAYIRDLSQFILCVQCTGWISGVIQNEKMLGFYQTLEHRFQSLRSDLEVPGTMSIETVIRHIQNTKLGEISQPSG